MSKRVSRHHLGKWRFYAILRGIHVYDVTVDGRLPTAAFVYPASTWCLLSFHSPKWPLLRHATLWRHADLVYITISMGQKRTNAHTKNFVTSQVYYKTRSITICEKSGGSATSHYSPFKLIKPERKICQKLFLNSVNHVHYYHAIYLVYLRPFIYMI